MNSNFYVGNSYSSPKVFASGPIRSNIRQATQVSTHNTSGIVRMPSNDKIQASSGASKTKLMRGLGSNVTQNQSIETEGLTHYGSQSSIKPQVPKNSGILPLDGIPSLNKRTQGGVQQHQRKLVSKGAKAPYFKVSNNNFNENNSGVGGQMMGNMVNSGANAGIKGLQGQFSKHRSMSRDNSQPKIMNFTEGITIEDGILQHNSGIMGTLNTQTGIKGRSEDKHHSALINSAAFNPSSTVSEFGHKRKLLEILKKANRDDNNLTTEEHQQINLTKGAFGNLNSPANHHNQTVQNMMAGDSILSIKNGNNAAVSGNFAGNNNSSSVGKFSTTGQRFRFGTPANKESNISNQNPQNFTQPNQQNSRKSNNGLPVLANTISGNGNFDDFQDLTTINPNNASASHIAARSIKSPKLPIPTEPNSGAYASGDPYLLTNNNNNTTKNYDNEDIMATEAAQRNPQELTPSPVNSISWESQRLPLTPQQVLNGPFCKYLTESEKKEILDFKEVWFIGPKAEKKQTPKDTEFNGGYDDEKGDYLVSMHDHWNYRYELVDRLGKGSFGQVFKAVDYKTKEIVALKVIRNKEKFHRQAKVEINIVDYIRQNDPDETSNLIIMRDTFNFRNHVCITFEILSVNLYDFLKANKFRGLSTNLIRRLAIQILQALAFLRKHKIIHCDLKPENILLKQADRSGIKIIDLGSSCFESEKMYTYIQSRYYRSPEVILGYSYDMAIDMWSFGCIMFELYTGFPIFSGESEKDQLCRIMEVFGKPDEHIINTCPRRSNFFDEKGEPFLAPDRKGRMHLPGAKSLEGLMQCDDPLFIDFVARCLNWYPTRRLTPEQGLLHEWIVSGLPTTIKMHHIQSVKSTGGLLTSMPGKNEETNSTNLGSTSSIKAPKSFKIKTNTTNPLKNSSLISGGSITGGGATDNTRSYYRNPGGLDNTVTGGKHAERSVDKSVNRRENSKFIDVSPSKPMKTSLVTSPNGHAVKTQWDLDCLDGDEFDDDN